MMRRCWLALLQGLLLLMLPSLALADASEIAPLDTGLACGTGCPDQLPVCNRDNQCGPCVQDSQCKGGKYCDVTFGQCIDLSEAKYGGGCSAQGQRAASSGATTGALGVFGLLLAVFFWAARARRTRARRSGLLAFGLVFAATSAATISDAAAQTTTAPTVTFNAQTFRPVAGPANVFTVEGTMIGRSPFPMGVVLFEYAHRPLRLVLNDGTTFANTVPMMATAHVMPGFSITRWLALSVDVPIVMYQAFDQRTPDSMVPSTPDVAGLGDVRLMTKFRIVNNDKGGFGFAAIPQFQFPSGSAADLRGDNTFGIEPRIAMDYRFKNGIFIALNVGYYVRTYNRTVDFGLTRVADQLRYGLGIGLPIAKGFGFAGEVTGAASFSKFDGGSFYLPLEGYLAARYTHKSGFEVTAGGGSGFLNAPGSPQFRTFLSLGYVPRGKPVRVVEEDDKPVKGVKPVVANPDPDDDGVLGLADACPNEAGPAATKGCPDTDKDGIADRDDKCKTEPGTADRKGCPVPDTDKDGILDTDDKCPDQPGPTENSGCPDQDQDKDGIVDRLDKCPTVSGPKENTGCPDADTDKDGIIDRLDKCPDKPAQRTSDGCPIIEIAETEIKLVKVLKFVKDSDQLEADSKPIITAIAYAVHDDPGIKKVKFTISASGDKKAAKKLVGQRAKTLLTALDNSGLPKKQVQIVKAKEPGEDAVSQMEVIRAKVKAPKAPKEKKEKKDKKDKKDRKKKKKDE